MNNSIVNKIVSLKMIVITSNDFENTKIKNGPNT